MNWTWLSALPNRRRLTCRSACPTDRSCNFAGWESFVVRGHGTCRRVINNNRL